MVAGGVGSLSWKLVYWFSEKSWPVCCHGLKNDLCTGFELVETATALGQTRQKRPSTPSCPSTRINATIDMTHSQMLGKFEYSRGPIFKVVLEC